jgi:hypothetical protein
MSSILFPAFIYEGTNLEQKTLFFDVFYAVTCPYKCKLDKNIRVLSFRRTMEKQRGKSIEVGLRRTLFDGTTTAGQKNTRHRNDCEYSGSCHLINIRHFCPNSKTIIFAVQNPTAEYGRSAVFRITDTPSAHLSFFLNYSTRLMSTRVCWIFLPAKGISIFDTGHRIESPFAPLPHREDDR